MKRLKSILNSVAPDSVVYRHMYEGEIVLHDPAHDMPPEADSDPIYYRDRIGYEITQPHKLAQSKPTVTVMIPADLIGLDAPSTAAADFCLRALAPYIDEINAALYNRARPDTENGAVYLCRPGGEVLVRNTAFFATCQQKYYTNGSGMSVYLLPDGEAPAPTLCLCLRMLVQLPHGNLKRRMQMLCRDLPDAVDAFVAALDRDALASSLHLEKTQETIRDYLRTSDRCAFIANGSILPRAKGSDGPLVGAVPFLSPPEDEIEIAGVRGMGVRRGVTVITGGGYSGKSTVLDAISAGIYNHARGDGRELCLTDDSAVTVSAEDGRCVRRMNISPFIKWIPGGNPTDFSTDHASGSTSQAANILEAVESGTRLLLIDEDRSATNFMIRDRMMKALIEHEPITPFTDRAAELYRTCGVSTVLVIGGSGEYLAVADSVYRMDAYRIRDVRAQARDICREHGVSPDTPPPCDWRQNRHLLASRFTSYPTGCGTERLAVSEMGFIRFGDEQIDMRGLHDLVTPRQADALGYMLRYLAVRTTEAELDLDARIRALYDTIAAEGLDVVFSSFFTTTERFLDLPRPQELRAVISRMRHVAWRK